MAFIINPNSVSVQQIKADLQSYLDSAPDSLKWKDFFATGSGQTMVDLIAGLGAFIAYNVIVGRRENFLPYVQNNSSAVGIAQALGYSAYRGRNAILQLTIIPSTTALIPKFTVVGTVKDQDLILLDDAIVNAGVATTMRVVIGLLQTEQQTVTTKEPQSFKFTTPGVSQDTRVFLNSVEVNTSERILDMINQKFAVQTNVLGSVNVLYLNLDTYVTQYNVGDIINIEWVALKDTTFTSTDLKFDFGSISSFTLESSFVPAESTASIQVNAPLFSETQFIIRGRDDYMKTFRLLSQALSDTSYVDVSPAVVDLSYAQKESCLFTNAQLVQFISQLSLFRPMGLAPPTISHPTIDFLDLVVSIKTLNAAGNPSVDVGVILDALEKVLEQKVVFADLENSIERFSYIKIARVAIGTTQWAANQYYRFGKHVTASPDTGKIYKANSFAYFAGSVEPTWPAVLPLTQRTVDGQIVWCMVPLDSFCPPASTTTWSAGARYKKGEVVLPSGGPISVPNGLLPPISVGFQVCDFVRKSKSDTPAVKSSGAYTGGLTAEFDYDGTRFTACLAGVAGNSISLSFDGIKTVQQVVDDWNATAGANCVVFSPPSQSTHVSAINNLTLSGGAASSNYTFQANTAGANGNNITLTFDNKSKVSEVVTSFNAIHPTNQVVVTNGNTNAVFPATTITLVGGSNLISGEPTWPGSLVTPC